MAMKSDCDNCGKENEVPCTNSDGNNDPPTSYLNNERGEDYQEQIGMPDEQNMRNWSHHHSTDTVDDPIFRAAMRGYDTVSFVFGLEVTWSLIQHRQQEEEEQQALLELETMIEMNETSNETEEAIMVDYEEHGHEKDDGESPRDFLDSNVTKLVDGQTIEESDMENGNEVEAMEGEDADADNINSEVQEPVATTEDETVVVDHVPKPTKPATNSETEIQSCTWECEVRCSDLEYNFPVKTVLTRSLHLLHIFRLARL